MIFFSNFEIRLRNMPWLDDNTIYHKNGVLYVTKIQLEAMKKAASQ